MTSEAAAGEVQAGSQAVFFSYSRDDQKRVLPLIKAIEQAGFTVWWDGLLGGGERYFLATQEALEHARVVVVAWSKVSVKSHWVHDEATRGRDRGRLVPISIDGTPPPLGFGQFQTVDLSHAKPHPEDPQFAKVIAAIAALDDPDRPVAATVDSSQRGLDRRFVIAGSGALVAAVAAGAAWRGGLFAPGETTNSIAVLPFANLSGDEEESYFSDGVAAEIRSSLARNPMLQVVAKTSSESFRETKEDAKAIARKLQVSHLLDGNVRKSGDKVRVSVELTEGKTGFSKWSQSFDRSLADVFAVQDEIADAVTSALSVALTNSGGKGRKRGTTNFAAYDAFLKGNKLYQQSDGEPSTRDALAKYEEAIALDPAYAAAWSARSRTLAYIASNYLQGSARASTFATAISSAEKSLALDPELADAYSALAYATLFGRRDAGAALAPFEKSAQLGQGESDVLTRYASYCAFVGEFDKGRVAINRAAKLDPLNALAQRSIGTLEFAARRFPDSIAALRRALAINPELTGAHASIAFNQLMLGQVEDAARSSAAEKGELRHLTAEAMVAQRQGDMARAEAALRSIDEQFGATALYEQAQVLAHWGAIERGIATLIKAAETGDPGLVLIKTDPLIDNLRGRPEFAGLLKQAGLA